MKVLHLSAGNLYGGIETYLATLARLRHLAPQMEPAFGLCFRGRLWDELTAAGVPVFELGAVRLSRPWTVLAARKRLRGAVAEWRPDVAVVHSGWPHLVFAPVVRASGVRLVLSIHTAIGSPSWLDRWGARTRPDLVLANSRFTASGVSKLFPGVRTQVVYLPVQVQLPEERAGTRAAVRSELNTPADAVVILTASRIEELKGHAVLFDALGRLAGVPGWVSWVAGGAQRQHEAELLARLKAQVERLGLSTRVRFLGPRTDVPRLLVSADVLCQPNTGPESFGLSFVEALAAGLPVVTTGIGGALEIVDESCGVLVTPGDAVELSAALGRLTAASDLRRGLAAGGPPRVTRWEGAEGLTRLHAALGGDR